MPYVAPEVLAKKVWTVLEFTPKRELTLHTQQDGLIVASYSQDVWSVGVVMFVMLTGTFPWAKARVGEKEYDAFLDGDVSQYPWCEFHPALIKVSDHSLD